MVILGGVVEDEDARRRAIMGARIANWRAHRGWSQAELGRQVGVTQGAVQYWEAGKRVPRWHELRALARILDVTPQRIVEPLMMDLTEGLGGDRGQDD